MTDDTSDTTRFAEQAMAAARAEAGRRIDAEMAEGRARARAIVEAAEDEAARIRRTAEEEAERQQARVNEVLAELVQLCDQLTGAGVDLADRLKDSEEELRALRTQG